MRKKTKKKPNKRSQAEFPGLNPKLNLKSRQEEIEDVASYAHTLSDKDKAWLNSYIEEEVNANFKHSGKKLNKSKKNKKRIYNKNNARNRDVYTRAQASGQINYLEDVFSSEEELSEQLKEMFNGSKNSDESGDSGK